ncbi:MAG: hypothetical protein D3904_04105, partial [Candidatus Electrothrix sp. EH2]|nr:hypothetical protein [Candidatus Electrothrix sp. EH2]
MINMSCTVLGRQRHIMQRTVDAAGKKEPCRDLDKGFPEHPFEPGGSKKAQNAEEEHDRNKKAAKYFQAPRSFLPLFFVFFKTLHPLVFLAILGGMSVFGVLG